MCLIFSQVPEPKSIIGTLSGFNNVAIPEAKDVVRVDMVGGFALQKVTSERSYFRWVLGVLKLTIMCRKGKEFKEFIWTEWWNKMQKKNCQQSYI